MNKYLMIALLALGIHLATAADDMTAEFKQMMDGSFRSSGIADKHRFISSTSRPSARATGMPSAERLKAIEAEQMKTIRWPSDGK